MFRSRYRKIEDYPNFIILFYEKILKKSLEDNNIDERERPELKEVDQHYLENKKN